VIILSKEKQSRVYTINLSKVWLSPRIRRTKRAINMIREFAQHHMKSEDVKIDQNLNMIMWKRGIRHPPRRIRVKMEKDEDDVVTVSLYSEEIKEEEKPKVKTAVSVPTTEIVTEEIKEKKETTSPKSQKAETKVVEEVEKKEKSAKIVEEPKDGKRK